MKRNLWEKVIVWMGLGITMIALCTGCGNTQDSGAVEEQALMPIIVGSDDYPPYSYPDTDGDPTGIDVELATEAFHRMGYEPVFSYINWEEKKTLLEDGQIDCIWCSFTMDGREEMYKWSGPYMISRQVIAVNKDSDIYTLEDLEGKNIAVQSTTKPEELFVSRSDPRIPEIGELFSLQNRELLYPFLSKGYADAIAAHETSILQCMSDYDLEYRILDEPLLNVGLGVAFSLSDDRGLDEELSRTLKEMQADGTTEQIIGKYLENPKNYLWEVSDEEK